MPRWSGAQSISAKLVYLMTFVICGTVATLTFQSANKFSDYIVQNIEEASTAMAERTAGEIANTIETWFAQMAVTVSKLPSNTKDAGSNDEGLAAALRADRDLWATSLYVVNNGSAALVRRAIQTNQQGTNSTLSNIKVDQLKKLMDSFAKESAINDQTFIDNRAIRNVTPELKNASLLLAIKLSIPGQDRKFAVMTTIADMTKIQVMLPQSRHTNGYVIDLNGHIFSATEENKILSPKFVLNTALVKKAIQKKSPSGFIPKFSDKSGVEKIGSFAQMPGQLPFFVIVERDRESAFQIITRTYLTSILWGFLIVLVAIMISYLAAGTLTKNLRDVVSATTKIAGGDFGVRLQPKSNDEIATLGHSVNHMAGKIQFLMSSEVEKARFEKELETARLVQSTFFPKSNITKNYLNVTGNYQPATECGGDLWGHYTIKENVELIYIADAMGHGAPAALVTAIAYAVCQAVSVVLNEDAGIDTSPSRLLKRLNKIIFEAVDGKISMTFFAGIVDFNQGKITFANAGHNFPFILTSSNPGVIKPVTLTLKGNPLGVDISSDYKEKTVDLRPGDKIILFTDGLIENNLRGADPLGRKRLIDLACSMGAEDAEKIKQAIVKKGASIYGTENLSDDVTVVVAEISKSWVLAPKNETPAQQTSEAQANPAVVSGSDVAASIFVPPPPPLKILASTAPSAPASDSDAKLDLFDLSISEPTLENQKEPNMTPSLSLGEGVLFELGDTPSTSSNDNKAEKEDPAALPLKLTLPTG